MKYIENNLCTYGKNSLCVGTENSSTNSLSEIIDKYISDALINGDQIIFFTDNTFYESIKINFNNEGEFLRAYVNTGKFKIKTYNIDAFDYDLKQFLDIIDIILVVKQRLRIIWDLRSVINSQSKLEGFIGCVKKIIQSSKDNVINMFYINNVQKLDEFIKLFDILIVIERNKKMIFTSENEIENAIWMLQSNYLLKNRLIENEKLRAMGEMTAGITHDINNILTPILGSVQLLKDKIKEKEHLKLLNVIEICAYDGMNITKKVKNLTQKCSDNNFEVFDIDGVISDAIDLTKNKWLTESIFKGIKIDINRSLNSKKTIKGNITEIREVFINIIANAIDAMPNGGIIEAITKNNDNMIIIEVKDNGIGMNEEIQKKIFNPFFTTKGNNGSGLGLSISHNIVLSHKGIIEIKSKEHVGTSFIVRLPIWEEVVINDGNQKSYIINFEGNVLIIDDQEEIRNVVSSMIKSIAKCKIKTCGCDDLDSELNRRKYDIIICDFTMPSINGFQVARKVKQIDDHTYFCLMTGWVGSFEDQDMKDIDFVLNKPINKESLKQMFSCYTR